MTARIFTLVTILLLGGCSPKPSEFDLASQAISENRPSDLAQIIQRDKALVNAASPFDGATLLHYASVNIPNVECAKILIDQGADVNRPDLTGATPLHLVCQFGTKSEAVALLLSSGALVNSRDKGNNTPLRISRKQTGDDEGIRILLSHGAIE